MGAASISTTAGEAGVNEAVRIAASRGDLRTGDGVAAGCDRGGLSSKAFLANDASSSSIGAGAGSSVGGDNAAMGDAAKTAADSEDGGRCV